MPSFGFSDDNDCHDLCQDILSFLLENPRGQDTLEGIAEWWLMEREIRRELARVQQALARLVAEGLVLEKRGVDGSVRYGLHAERMEEIRRRITEARP